LALTPQSNEAFFREVDDELRRDEALAVWRRYGKAIVAAVVLGLVALAGYLWWLSHRENQAAEQGVRYSEALDHLGANNPAAAAPILDELAKNGGTGYGTLSRFLQADIALQKNNLTDAAKIFGEVASDASVDEPLRNLALLRQTAAEYDSLKPQVVIDRLRPLAVKGGPWFGSAGEMTAVAHLRMGRRDLAGRVFGEIASDQNVPASLRERAVQMAGVLGVDAVPQPAPAQQK
jgi:hypothetical protein